MIEAIAGLVFLSVIVAVVIGAVVGVPRLLAQRRFTRSLAGRIARKQQELASQESYLAELRTELTDPALSDSRKQCLATYQELAEKKRRLLALQLETLQQERDTQEFEQRMDRRERR